MASHYRYNPFDEPTRRALDERPVHTKTTSKKVTRPSALSDDSLVPIIHQHNLSYDEWISMHAVQTMDQVHAEMTKRVESRIEREESEQQGAASQEEDPILNELLEDCDFLSRALLEEMDRQDKERDDGQSDADGSVSNELSEEDEYYAYCFYDEYYDYYDNDRHSWYSQFNEEAMIVLYREPESFEVDELLQPQLLLEYVRDKENKDNV